MRLISTFLRLVNKPMLARARPEDLPWMRARLRRIARVLNAAEGRGALRLEGRDPEIAWTGAPDRGAAILYLHGGGFLLCAPETHRRLAEAVAAAAGAPAAMVRYRLAPEHPHPAQIADALAAYARLSAQGLRLAVAGDSAGGGLALALIQAARARGLPDPAAVVAFSPWCDMTATSPSIAANAAADAMLPAERVAEVAARRMGGTDPRDPLASPVFARYDRPPPPTLLFASRTEILAGDAEAMARALRDAGGAAELVWEAAAPHAWPIFTGAARDADRAVARAGAFLRATLHA